MFEKFTKDARESVVGAQVEARALGADRIGTEHVLLGMLRAPDSVAARSLQRLGVAHADVLAAVRTLPPGAIDAEALAGVGIDLDAVRAQVEASFRPGALDTPPRSRAGHLLLAVVRLDDSTAYRALSSLGVGPAAAREAVAAVWADVPVG